MALLRHQRGVSFGDALCRWSDVRTLPCDGWLANPPLRDRCSAYSRRLLARWDCGEAVVLTIPKKRKRGDKMKSQDSCGFGWADTGGINLHPQIWRSGRFSVLDLREGWTKRHLHYWYDSESTPAVIRIPRERRCVWPRAALIPHLIKETRTWKHQEKEHGMSISAFWNRTNDRIWMERLSLTSLSQAK